MGNRTLNLIIVDRLDGPAEIAQYLNDAKVASEFANLSRILPDNQKAYAFRLQITYTADGKAKIFGIGKWLPVLSTGQGHLRLGEPVPSSLPWFKRLWRWLSFRLKIFLAVQL